MLLTIQYKGSYQGLLMANMTDSDNRNLSFLVKTEYSVFCSDLINTENPKWRQSSLSPPSVHV